jgi:hypothetical protein
MLAEIPGYAASLYEKTFVKWTARLYLAYFWKFAEPVDICAALTGSPASFWDQHILECEQRIAKDFYSFFVVAESLAIASAVFLGCCCRSRRGC